jgi:hypothetical protein
MIRARAPVAHYPRGFISGQGREAGADDRREVDDGSPTGPIDHGAVGDEADAGRVVPAFSVTFVGDAGLAKVVTEELMAPCRPSSDMSYGQALTTGAQHKGPQVMELGGGSEWLPRGGSRSSPTTRCIRESIGGAGCDR